MEMSTDAFWEADAQHRITVVLGSAQTSEVCSHWIGLPVWALPTLALNDAGRAALRDAFERQVPVQNVELICHRSDGSPQWLTLSGEPVRDGAGHGGCYRGVVRDTTLLKKAQQAHEQQRKLTRTLAQRVPGLVFQLRKGPSGWFSLPFTTAALQELFDVQPDEVLSNAAPVFSRILPEDYKQCWTALDRSASQLTPLVTNYRVRMSDGRIKWHAINAVPYREPDGSTVWHGFTNDITDRVHADEQLTTAHEQLRTRTNLMEVTLSSLSQGVMMIAPDGRVTYHNQRLLELLDLPDDLLARQPTLVELVDWQHAHGHFGLDIKREDLKMWGDYSHHHTLSFPPQYVRTTHKGHTLEVKTHVLEGGGWVRTFADVSDYFQAQQALERSELHLRALFDAIPDRVWLKNTEGVFIMCNPSTAQGYGRPTGGILGRTEAELSLGDNELDNYEATDRRALASHEPVVYEQALPLGDGVGIFDVVKRAVFDRSGQAIGVLGIARNVTERKRAEEQIERLAFFDPLTGLCNRRLFHDRLAQAQVASTRHGQWAAVCFIDLDNFKDLNDTQGHDQGDLLLKQVSQRLQAAVREQDTVARLGGDEFVLLLEELGSAEDQAALYANNVGQKLLDALTVPYALGRGPHHNTPSIGITLFRDHNERVEDILKRADLAMYQSKSAGRNTVRFFDPHMQEVVQRRSELERDLRQALAQGELQLYSQAVVNASGQPTGHEALLRWLHPTRGMVSPAEFIPVAEQTGLILAIGDWVLRAACQRLVSWGNHPATTAWTMAVNLSARQLRQSDFVQRVRAVLADTGANPHLLKLELTESLLLHDVEDTILKMDELARLGIRFSLDDFGTGYSSLSYLKRLPLSVLKIDQSFVRDLLTDPNDAAIARTIMQLAQSLDLKVVAEGVETEGQMHMLQRMGCESFQGYLFGRPAPI
jgi:diguanylate cyclase (GGDEF)-like protein/PAS domain S-box-containing protein